MTQPLDGGGHPRRPLGGIGAFGAVTDVEDVRRLNGEGFQPMGVGDDPYLQPAGVDEVGHDATEGLWQRTDTATHSVGQSHHVCPLGGGECHCAEPTRSTTADDHAR